MTSQEQRVAIAEHCGWKVIQNGLGSTIIMREAAPDEWHIVDPLSDLNAMHEAEKMLVEGEQVEFSYHLKEICCPITGEDWPAIHATASQRAEAFLKTIGKYKSQ